MVERPTTVGCDVKLSAGMNRTERATVSGEGLDGEWPWWLGRLPSGHNHGNERLSKMTIPHMTRNGKPSTCPALIHAALSELTMPTIKHKVVSEPDYDQYDRSNMFSQGSYRSGKSGSTYLGSMASSTVSSTRREKLCAGKGNGAWWLQSCMEEPGEKGEIKPSWISNFHVSEKRVHWKGLGYSKSTLGYYPHREAGKFRPPTRDRPSIPVENFPTLPNAPMPKPKDAPLDTGQYRELTSRTATLRALSEECCAKANSLESTVNRKIVKEFGNKRKKLRLPNLKYVKERVPWAN